MSISTEKHQEIPKHYKCCNCNLYKLYPEQFRIEYLFKMNGYDNNNYKDDKDYFCTDCFIKNPDTFRRRNDLRITREKNKYIKLN